MSQQFDLLWLHHFPSALPLDNILVHSRIYRCHILDSAADTHIVEGIYSLEYDLV